MNQGAKAMSNLLRSTVLSFRIAGLTVLMAVVGLVASPVTRAADVLVYKSPTCGCCGKWVEHMQQAGFSVEVQETANLVPIKQQMGVPPQLQSCHTAVVGGYLIEGHVPADDIRRLLAERPDIKGLAVPGMPLGSPGMEGPRKDPYAVLAVDKQGGVEVFSRH